MRYILSIKGEDGKWNGGVYNWPELMKKYFTAIQFTSVNNIRMEPLKESK